MLHYRVIVSSYYINTIDHTLQLASIHSFMNHIWNLPYNNFLPKSVPGLINEAESLKSLKSLKSKLFYIAHILLFSQDLMWLQFTFTTFSTYRSPPLQVSSAKRNNTVLSGAKCKGQLLSWEQTSRQQ